MLQAVDQDNKDEPAVLYLVRGIGSQNDSRAGSYFEPGNRPSFCVGTQKRTGALLCPKSICGKERTSAL